MSESGLQSHIKKQNKAPQQLKTKTQSMLKKISKILTKKNNIKFLNNREKTNHQIVKTDKIIKNTTFIKSLRIIK